MRMAQRPKHGGAPASSPVRQHPRPRQLWLQRLACQGVVALSAMISFPAGHWRWTGQVRRIAEQAGEREDHSLFAPQPQPHKLSGQEVA